MITLSTSATSVQGLYWVLLFLTATRTSSFSSVGPRGIGQRTFPSVGLRSPAFVHLAAATTTTTPENEDALRPTKMIRSPDRSNPAAVSVVVTAPNNSNNNNKASVRKVRRTEKFARLPVWPAWNGALIWLVGLMLGSETASRLEQVITGRVCPNFYEYTETSPFVMLVHHCHSFAALDPLRHFQRTFVLPEGFPAHPHRGFVTITYILHGGFVHRDSEGVKQSYGAADVAQYGGKHTQWLTTGRGMLHEEMFDNAGLFHSRQELYQIWLNVPARDKWVEPRSVLLGGNDETPLVEENNSTSQTLVLAGSYQGRTAAAPAVTNLVLFHVTLQPGATWKYNLPASYATAFLYLRQGSLTSHNDAEAVRIPVHWTAYFAATGDSIEVTADVNDGADFIFLAGEPIVEPCVASGSMVMNHAREIEQAYADYQTGKFGRPWDHKLSDAEWSEHVRRNGPRF